MSVLPTCVYVYALHKDQNRELDLIRLELWTAMNCHVHAGN